MSTNDLRPWMTVIVRELQTEVLLWEDERDARAYFETASTQWMIGMLGRVEEHHGGREVMQSSGLPQDPALGVRLLCLVNDRPQRPDSSEDDA